MGGEFTTFAGNGNGNGHDTGFAYDGKLTDIELAAFENWQHLTTKLALAITAIWSPATQSKCTMFYSSAKVAPG